MNISACVLLNRDAEMNTGTFELDHPIDYYNMLLSATITEQRQFFTAVVTLMYILRICCHESCVAH